MSGLLGRAAPRRPLQQHVLLDWVAAAGWDSSYGGRGGAGKGGGAWPAVEGNAARAGTRASPGRVLSSGADCRGKGREGAIGAPQGTDGQLCNGQGHGLRWGGPSQTVAAAATAAPMEDGTCSSSRMEVLHTAHYPVRGAHGAAEDGGGCSTLITSYLPGGVWSPGGGAGAAAAGPVAWPSKGQGRLLGRGR